MADTTFVPRVTTIVSTWLQAINDRIYKGRSPNFATTTGSANAQVLTLATDSLYIGATDGDTFQFVAGFTNTGATTLQVIQPSGTLAAVALQVAGQACVGGELIAGQTYFVVRLGSTWQLFPNGNFLQAGVAAVARADQIKVREWVSVEDFGAIGDGVTDDSAAFTAALATKKAVRMLAKTYKVSFDMPSGGVLVGEGCGSTDGTFDHTRLIPPTGATYVIRVSASVSASNVWCEMRDFAIYNPNAVASCKGIFFSGTDVTSINDMHRLDRIRITGLDVGVSVVGRLIGTVWTLVEITQCRIGFLSVTDAVNVAFIFNSFRNCLFNQCEAEGMRIEDVSLDNIFDMCNWQENNSDDVAGVAAFYIESPRNLTIRGGYFEANGSVAVDAAVPLNNGLDLRISGTSITQRLSIRDSYFAAVGAVGAGCSVYIDSNPLYSGVIENNMFLGQATGFALVTTYPQNADTYPIDALRVGANMFNERQVLVVGTDSLYPVGFEQSTSWFYYSNGAGVQPAIDLLRVSRYSIHNNAVAIDIATVANRQPSCEMIIWNAAGAANVTINAALMANATTVTLLPGEAARLVVATYPHAGKFVQV